MEHCRAKLRAAPDLNPSQRAAVEATLGRRCTVIQGPPGTGKTTTAVHALHSWVNLGIRPILATADGNIAVDNIAEGLAKRGVKVVRVGRPEKVQACLEALTLDAQLRARQELQRREEADEAQRKRLDVLSKISVAELLARLRERHAGAASGGDAVKDSAPAAAAAELGVAGELQAMLDSAARRELVAEQEAEAFEEAAQRAERSEADLAAESAAKRRAAFRAEQQLRVQVLQEADVVCTQMISAGGGVLAPLGPFQGMLIDEVGQATELTTIVPIVQRGCQRLVLAGDHCQLPPTVQSREAESRGLSVSLFGRLVGQGVTAFFLDTQFRSHPKLAEFSAEAIYDGKLASGIGAEARQLLSGFQWPSGQVPVAFVESGREARESAEGESRLNEQEADRLLDVLEGVLDAGGCDVSDAGVVTPYMAQVRLLRQKWRERCAARAKAAKAAKEKAEKKRKKQQGDAPAPSASEVNGAPQWWRTPRDLEIASVDHFQGREKELIVFSSVRNNGGGKVGFLSDWRRLNVMLTRARRGLIVIGNAWTLRHDPMWKKWLAWCGRHQVVVDRQELHRAVKRALREPGLGRGPKELLKGLFDLEQAPRQPKPFKALLRSLSADEGPSPGPEDLRAAWAAFAAAREALEAEAAAWEAEAEEWAAAAAEEEAAAEAEPSEVPAPARKKRRRPSLGEEADAENGAGEQAAAPAASKRRAKGEPSAEPAATAASPAPARRKKRQRAAEQSAEDAEAESAAEAPTARRKRSCSRRRKPSA